ncbi:disproportionating enzyme, partial [Haematococcus lacustris]
MAGWVKSAFIVWAVGVTSMLLLLLNSSNSGLASLPANTTITWDGFTCRNVARFINLTIFYTWLASDEDPEGTASINKVSVGIITADVASTAAALQQSWRLQFTRTVEAGAGVRVLQPFSGAPGYLPGLPLLAGVLATFDPTGQGVAQKTAVERLVGGLPIPGPGEGGVCAPLASSPAVWGFNATSSCAIPLTADDLRLFC